MKKYLLTLVTLLMVLHSFGQSRKESREKIKALKVAFLTKELNLSSAEAEKFWPLYNSHEEKLDTYRDKGRSEIKRKLKEVGDFDNLNEEEAKKFLKLKLDLERKTLIEKEDFFKKVSKFLSYKKIMKLHVSEREFAKKLMYKYGRGRKPKDKERKK
ncbi:sensor of ECF-type sigma factor [Polaribacter sp.]|uniref:sensor of ECF-type sigma factor n=1 Tax=Polaribacter sp. TaxID=1920175 RepID=UPI003F6C0E5D